jgi:hypothetical protein
MARLHYTALDSTRVPAVLRAPRVKDYARAYWSLATGLYTLWPVAATRRRIDDRPDTAGHASRSRGVVLARLGPMLATRKRAKRGAERT